MYMHHAHKSLLRPSALGLAYMQNHALPLNLRARDLGASVFCNNINNFKLYILKQDWDGPSLGFGISSGTSELSWCRDGAGYSRYRILEAIDYQGLFTFLR